MSGQQSNGISDDFRIEDSFKQVEMKEVPLQSVEDLDLSKISLTDFRIGEMKSNNDIDLLAATLFGVNPSMGDRSNVLLKQELPSLTVDKTPFESHELDKWVALLTGIEVFKSNLEVDKSKTELMLQTTKNETELERIELELARTGVLLQQIDNAMSGKRLALENIRTGKQMRANAIHEKNAEIKRLQGELEQLMKHKDAHERKSKELNGKRNLYKQKQQAIRTQFLSLLEKDGDQFVPSVTNHIREKFSNAKKIVRCEFSYRLNSDKRYRKTGAYIECECGHLDFYASEDLPIFVAGDVYNDFNAKKRRDNTVTNMFKPGGIEGQRQHSLEYSSIKEVMYSRLSVPHTKCTGCGHHILFPYDSALALTESGMLSNEHALELLESNKYSDFKKIEGYRILLSDPHAIEVLASLNIEDFLAGDLRVDKLAYRDVIRLDDQPDGAKSKFHEKIMEKYSHILRDGSGSFAAVYDEFRNHEFMISRAIKNLASNKNFKHFVSGRGYLFFTYCIEENLTDKDLENLVYQYRNNFEALKLKLTGYMIDNFLDSMIKRQPFFLFENDRLRPIYFIDRNLPHYTFIECFKPLVREYLLNKINSVVDGATHMQVSSIFEKFREVKTVDDEIRALAKSEEIVRFLKKELSYKFDLDRKQLFIRYITVPENLLKNRIEDKLFPWFYEEMTEHGLATALDEPISLVQKRQSDNILSFLEADSDMKKDPKELSKLAEIISADPHQMGNVVDKDLDQADFKKKDEIREEQEKAMARELLERGDFYADKIVDEEGNERIAIFNRSSSSTPYEELLYLPSDDPRLKEDESLRRDFENFKKEFHVEDISFEEFLAKRNSKIDDLF